MTGFRDGSSALTASPASQSARAHAMVTIDVGSVERPLFCQHADGSVGVRVVDGDVQVWLDGAPDDLHAFASQLHHLVNDAVRELPKAPSRDVEEPVVLPKVDEERVA